MRSMSASPATTINGALDVRGGAVPGIAGDYRSGLPRAARRGGGLGRSAFTGATASRPSGYAAGHATSRRSPRAARRTAGRPAALLRGNLRDLAWINRRLGGTRASRRAIDGLLARRARARTPCSTWGPGRPTFRWRSSRRRAATPGRCSVTALDSPPRDPRRGARAWTRGLPRPIGLEIVWATDARSRGRTARSTSSMPRSSLHHLEPADAIAFLLRGGAGRAARGRGQRPRPRAPPLARRPGPARRHHAQPVHAPRRAALGAAGVHPGGAPGPPRRRRPAAGRRGGGLRGAPRRDRGGPVPVGRS